MNHPTRSALLGAVLLATAGSASAAEETVLMSVPWAAAACDAWNAEPILTDRLHESGWATNDKERGYKAMHLYRTDCPDSPRVELRISAQEGKAVCVYGGAIETKKLDDDVDYVMHAETVRWQEMGAGDYGPMRAMMFGRLKFEGPKFEAMGNMGPFGRFLKLTGEVPGGVDACP